MHYDNMLATIPLALSIVGLLILFAVKEWERSSGRMLFSNFRKRADTRVLDLHALFRTIPKYTRDVLEYLVHHGAYQGSRTVLLLLRTVERRLMGILNMIKGKGVVTKRELPSSFLRHVAEHKNDIREKRNEKHPKNNMPE